MHINSKPSPIRATSATRRQFLADALASGAITAFTSPRTPPLSRTTRALIADYIARGGSIRTYATGARTYPPGSYDNYTGNFSRATRCNLHSPIAIIPAQ